MMFELAITLILLWFLGVIYLSWKCFERVVILVKDGIIEIMSYYVKPAKHKKPLTDIEYENSVRDLDD